MRTRVVRTVAPPPTADTLRLAALFLTSGVLHLVRPQIFEPLVPRILPVRREIVLMSGAAEIACAVGLLGPRTRRVAGWASAALLVGVLPGNVQMAVTAHRRAQRAPTDLTRQALRAATIARLPFQVPLIRTALRAAGRRR